MLVIQILIFFFFTVPLPVFTGVLVTTFVDKQRKNICFMWMAGFLLLLGAFQVMAVPFILLKTSFTLLFWCYLTISLGLGAAGIFMWLYRRKKSPCLQEVKNRAESGTEILWVIFGIILVVQLILAVVLAFGDGDDAYYVSAATTTDAFDNMYLFHPYNGGSTPLEIRHCLAPFPVYIAFLSRVSGFHAGAVSQVGMQLVLIPLTYCIYGLIGNRLFRNRKKYLAVFLLFVEILVLFGNYSFYTAETFLMTRTRQGKSALGNIVIPALFLLLFLIGERMAENKKIEKSLWILVFTCIAVSSLCSTMGGFLTSLLLGLYTLCMMLIYKRFTLLIPTVICVLPAALYMGLYVMLK